MTDAEAQQLKPGDRVRVRLPEFPEKRPSVHTVTQVITNAGEHGEKIMLLVDGAMGVDPAWCERQEHFAYFPSDGVPVLIPPRLRAFVYDPAESYPTLIDDHVYEAMYRAVDLFSEKLDGRVRRGTKTTYRRLAAALRRWARAETRQDLVNLTSPIVFAAGAIASKPRRKPHA